MRINLVLSVFNEAPQIQELLTQICTELKKRPAFTYQLYILNNGSTDNTEEKIIQFIASSGPLCNGMEIFMIENEKSLGPAESHQRLFEIALSDPSDYVLKLDRDLDTSVAEVINKFLAHLEQPANHGQILTGLKTMHTVGEGQKFSKYRQTFIASELRATCTSNYFFQEGVGPQAFPTEALRKLVDSSTVQNYGGRRGWDIFLPMQAKKLGHQLVTIPLDQVAPKPSWQGAPGVKYQDEVLQIVFRRIAASN